MSENYPAGVTDPHFDLPSVGETEEESEDICWHCGNTPETGACFYCKAD